MQKVILTADDSASVRQMIGFTLKRGEYQVIAAVDGKDALTKAKTSEVHMVITDLNMPEMSGLDLIRAL